MIMGILPLASFSVLATSTILFYKLPLKYDVVADTIYLTQT